MATHFLINFSDVEEAKAAALILAVFLDVPEEEDYRRSNESMLFTRQEDRSNAMALLHANHITWESIS